MARAGNIRTPWECQMLGQPPSLCEHYHTRDAHAIHASIRQTVLTFISSYSEWEDRDSNDHIVLKGTQGREVALQSQQGKQLGPVPCCLPGLSCSSQLAIGRSCPAGCYKLSLQLRSLHWRPAAGIGQAHRTSLLPKDCSKTCRWLSNLSQHALLGSVQQPCRLFSSRSHDSFHREQEFAFAGSIRGQCAGDQLQSCRTGLPTYVSFACLLLGMLICSHLDEHRSLHLTVACRLRMISAKLQPQDRC